jgi:predicted esterase
VVAPEALSRFYVGRAAGGDPARVGATWMTREDRLAEIADYVRYLDRALDAATEGIDLAALPVGVLAFSQGAATATRWVAHRHRHGLAVPGRLVIWGGALPDDLALDGADGDALRATRLTLVVGDADEFATPAVVAGQEARLHGAGVPYEVVRYPGGHRIDGAVLGRLLGD